MVIYNSKTIDMKKTINYSWAVSLIFLVLLFTTFSCSKESVEESVTETPVVEANLQPIKVFGQHSPEATKTTLDEVATSWVAGDKVGVFSTEARAQAGGAREVGVANAPFTAASSELKSGFNGTMYWGAENASHSFYAYYPYAAGSLAATAVPVSLLAAQTQSQAGNSAHLGALDFLIATPVTVTSPNNTETANGVSLTYNHLFTVIEFHIKGTGSLKAISLIANETLAFSGGTVDITKPTPEAGEAYTLASLTGTSKETKVMLTTPASLTATSTDTKVYMVINPSTPTGNCLIGLLVDGANWKYTIKAAPSSGFKRGKKYIVTIDASTSDFGTVVGPGGVWMDRNLGATRVATSSKDAQAYGYYYQWGRGNDGHQESTSGTSTALSSTAVPSDPSNQGKFIIGSGNFYDWIAPQIHSLWQGGANDNNPCPNGFRIPTYSEWNNVRGTLTGSNKAEAAFNSSLKLPAAGCRTYTDLFSLVGYHSFYWSSGTADTKSYYLNLTSGLGSAGTALMKSNVRSSGYSVRCIKD